MSSSDECAVTDARIRALEALNAAYASENAALEARADRLEAENQLLRASADAVLVAENVRLRHRANRAGWCLNLSHPAVQSTMALRDDNRCLEALVAALHARLQQANIQYDLMLAPIRHVDHEMLLAECQRLWKLVLSLGGDPRPARF